ncbi:MAG: UDP-N-acetylmuramate dehydrogenase, partial [Flavobacteriales bacterium]|nr:UDP-N-acetylmuramate dehydrogenase [Flavobacteriales bacterium]
MNIQKNISLKPYNTFGIEAIAKQFVEITESKELLDLYSEDLLKDIFVIGFGSNMLLTSDVNKLVVKISSKGKEIISEENNKVIVKASAGEDWPDFVLWSIDQGLYGLENLSKIPGNVGTSPIQNIGAYGTEIKDAFYKLEAFEIATGETKTFYNSDCNFGYRESIFKKEEKGNYIITNVYFELKKQGELNINYGAIKIKLEEKEITNPTPKDVSGCVIEIRTSKLPDPKEIGNSGSFFKNPVISADDFRLIKQEYPDAPSYTLENGNEKVPAGWLIEKSGWKGYRKGDAGV